MIYLIFACKVFFPSALFTCSVTKYMLSCRTRFHLSAFWSLHKQRECKKQSIAACSCVWFVGCFGRHSLTALICCFFCIPEFCLTFIGEVFSLPFVTHFPASCPFTVANCVGFTAVETPCFTSCGYFLHSYHCYICRRVVCCINLCVAHACSLLSLLNTNHLYYCALIHVKFFVFTERISITYLFWLGNYFINHFICWFILSSVNHRNISSNKEFLLNAVLLMLGLTIFSVCALFPCPVLYSFPGKCHRITYFP